MKIKNLFAIILAFTLLIVGPAYAELGVSNGLGHAETTGLGSGGAGKTWSGTTWSASGGKALNTPVAGTEKVSNSDMETDDPPASWVASNSTLSQVADERTGGAGSKSLGLARNGADSFNTIQKITTVVGTWYALNYWIKNVDAVGGRVMLEDTSSGTLWAQGVGNYNDVTWANKIFTGRALDTDGRVRAFGYSTGADGVSVRYDDVSLKPLTLSELIATTETSTRDVIATVAIATTPAGTQAGLAVGINSATDPTYGVIAYHDGTNAKLDKIVNGVWTNVISAAATWADNAEIRVIRDGTTFRLYYNNAQVGATSTISDVGDYTLHGLFSTYSGNRLDNFSVYARGTNGEYSNLNAMMAPPNSGGGFGIGFGTGF